MLNKSIKIAIVILITLILTFLGIYFYDNWTAKIQNEESKKVVDVFNNYNKTPKESFIETNKIIGTIEIEKISICYPIIQYIDEGSLNIAICKFGEQEINKNGNLCLLGHNMRNNTFFSKLNQLENEDIVKITDQEGQTIKYKVYEITMINPEDISVLEQIEGTKQVTLITCNNSSSKRLTIKLK